MIKQILNSSGNTFKNFCALNFYNQNHSTSITFAKTENKKQTENDHFIFLRISIVMRLKGFKLIAAAEYRAKTSAVRNTLH